MKNVGDRERIGNHSLTAIEAVLGVPDRKQFQDLEGTPTAPDTAALTILRPNGEVVVYAWPTPSGDELTLTAESGMPSGEENTRFYADVLYDVPGRWRVSLAGTGAATVNEQIVITVQSNWVEP